MGKLTNSIGRNEEGRMCLTCNSDLEFGGVSARGCWIVGGSVVRVIIMMMHE